MKTNLFFKIWTGLVLFFLLFPFLVIVYASFSNSALITVPLKEPGFDAYLEIFLEGKYVKSLMLSLELAFFATVFGTVLGTFASFALVRNNDSRLVRMFNNLLLAPLMVPMVIIGVALMITINKMSIPMNKGLLILIHTVIVLPYVIRPVSASLAHFNRSIEEASMVMGAGPWRTLFEISLPNIRTGIVTGAILAYICSFGEVVATAFILPIGMTTLPVEILNTLLYNFSPSIASIAALVSFIIFAVLFVLFHIFPSAFVNNTP